MRPLKAHVPGAKHLDHVGISVGDLAGAVRFFEDHFDATVTFRLPPITDADALARIGLPEGLELNVAMLDMGTGRLELLECLGGGRRALPRSAAGEASHVAVEVDDVPEALDYLRGAPDVVVIGEPVTFDTGPTPGLCNAFVRYRAGGLVELVSWGIPPSGPDEGR